MVILLVDYDDGDALAFERTLQDVAPTATCHRVKTPAEAHWYLLGLGRYSDRERYPLPRIVVVCVPLRRGAGSEFMDWIHAHSELEGIRSCVFSRTPLPPEEEARLARETGCVFTKPQNQQEWKSVLQRIIATELVEHSHPA